MEKDSLSRWEKFYLDDPRLGSLPPSSCADQAARLFIENNSQIILDLGCGTGRDSLLLASRGMKVIGLDATHSGLLLAQKRESTSHHQVLWLESDSRTLPFPDDFFDGIYCFGLIHEFVGQSAEAAVSRTMAEIYRVLKVLGIAVVATAAGDPEKGLPHVQNFTESMFDEVTAKFHCIEKKLYFDLGCTGRTDYKVWFGHFTKHGL